MEQTDLSLLTLVVNTDIFGKLVILLLILLSIISWAVIIQKAFLFRKIQKSSHRFITSFRQSDSLFQLADSLETTTLEPTEKMFLAAIREWRISTHNQTVRRASLDHRINKVLDITLAEESHFLERYLSFLATVSSTAPFIGLFGTVWGIMNAFQSIAASKQTNLAVVAPGISEALFATALGLIAAIPAAYFYNHFTTKLNDYTGTLERFGEQFMVILSRHFDKTLKEDI